MNRLCFDTPEEYQTYTRSVVDVETTGSAKANRAAFFGVCNADTPATEAASEHLARLFGEGNSSMLFTASHGMGFDVDYPRQREARPTSGA